MIFSWGSGWKDSTKKGWKGECGGFRGTSRSWEGSGGVEGSEGGKRPQDGKCSANGKEFGAYSMQWEDWMEWEQCKDKSELKFQTSPLMMSCKAGEGAEVNLGNQLGSWKSQGRGDDGVGARGAGGVHTSEEMKGLFLRQGAFVTCSWMWRKVRKRENLRVSRTPSGPDG